MVADLTEDVYAVGTINSAKERISSKSEDILRVNSTQVSVSRVIISNKGSFLKML
jgi:hypothetical protein